MKQILTGIGIGLLLAAATLAACWAVKAGN